jgi:hypothetical protein
VTSYRHSALISLAAAISTSGICPSMGDPRGISPILEQNLKSKSKLDPGYLLALTAEVIEGNGQPKDGFLKEPFVRGSSMVQRASTTHSAGSKDIGTGSPMLHLEPCSRSCFDPKFSPVMGLIPTLELPILGLELCSCDSS